MYKNIYRVSPRKAALAKMVILEIGVLINISVYFVSLPCARPVETLTFISTTSEPCRIVSESWGGEFRLRESNPYGTEILLTSYVLNDVNGTDSSKSQLYLMVTDGLIALPLQYKKWHILVSFLTISFICLEVAKVNW